MLYYSDDHVTIYHGDCLEIMGDLAAGLLVTDPPYGIDQGVKGPRRNGKTNRAGHRTRADSGAAPIAGDESTDLRDQVLALWGSTRPALVFGSWKAPRPPDVRARLLWLKAGTNACLGGTPWSPADEEIYVLGAGWSGPVRLNFHVTNEARAGADGLAALVGHPTPKPVGLMRDLLALCPDGTLLDPFAGSGSTLRAAKDLGRKAIGIEIEERHCEIAARQLAQEVLPL